MYDCLFYFNFIKETMMSNYTNIISECEKLLRFGTQQLQNMRTKYIVPALDKMHKSKKM